MNRAWLVPALCTAAFGTSITYNYTGNPFTTCTSGSCPSNFTSDYIQAQVTLTQPATQSIQGGATVFNYLTSPNNQYLVSWIIVDQFSLQFSSTDPNSSSELKNPSNQVPGLWLGAYSNGALDTWSIQAGTPLGIYGPIGTFVPGTPGDFINNGSWAAKNTTPGTWTETLNGLAGGAASAPVSLETSGTTLTQVTGSISGSGSQDYYSFYWFGGAFSASAQVGATGSDSYLFSAGVAGTCNSLQSQTLNSGDSWQGTISLGNLAAGQYCIGLDDTGGGDPNFALTFNTPLSTPEPSGFLLLLAGLGTISALRYQRRAP